MRAATIYRYGDADELRVEERPTPEPKGSELLVAVRFAAVNPVDWKMREGRNRLVLGPGWPKVLGHDFAGEVIATGRRVTRFSPGDAVYGMQGLAMGAYATHLIVSEKIVSAKPEGLDFEEAAALPMVSLTALQGLRDQAGLVPGQRVLINGASGGVGTAAVQIAAILGADITGVCSARNAERVLELGADRVIDYNERDFATEGEAYDVVFDCVGTTTFAHARQALGPRGVFVSVKSSVQRVVGGAVCNLFRRQRETQVAVAIPSAANLAWVTEQVRAGRYRPVLDRRFALEDVQDAHRYSETGRARGKITIEMPDAR